MTLPTDLEMLKHKRYAKNTDRKSRWGVTAYCEWRYKAIKDFGDAVEPYILRSDLTKPKELLKSDFCQAMCKFVTEVRKHNGEDYPPNSLKGMVNAIQFYLHSDRVHWLLLPKLGGPFIVLYYVVDNLMKDRTRKGMGVIKHSTLISSKMEDQMWKANVLGEDTDKVAVRK